MIIDIEHETRYKYTQPIFPEPSHLYFYPLPRPYLRILDYELNVTPEPSGLSQRIDVENNLFHQMWYNESLSSLSILVRMRVEVTPFNPFGFLIESEPKTPHQEAVVPYVTVTDDLAPVVIKWVEDIEFVTSDRLTFVTMIAREIGTNWEHALRYDSALLTTNQCFLEKKGSCRDLSWMMIQMMRHQNIPARFVSGYAYNPELEGHELHGWVEVWLQGAGWIALDPSAGLLATEAYVPLASSYHPVNTLPVQGTFRGQAEAAMKTRVSLRPFIPE